MAYEELNQPRPTPPSTPASSSSTTPFSFGDHGPVDLPPGRFSSGGGPLAWERELRGQVGRLAPGASRRPGGAAFRGALLLGHRPAKGGAEGLNKVPVTVGGTTYHHADYHAGPDPAPPLRRLPALTTTKRGLRGSPALASAPRGAPGSPWRGQMAAYWPFGRRRARDVRRPVPGRRHLHEPYDLGGLDGPELLRLGRPRPDGTGGTWATTLCDAVRPPLPRGRFQRRLSVPGRVRRHLPPGQGGGAAYPRRSFVLSFTKAGRSTLVPGGPRSDVTRRRISPAECRLAVDHGQWPHRPPTPTTPSGAIPWAAATSCPAAGSG